MKSYQIEEKYRFDSVSTSKGTQKKYRKDNYFYKVNKVGNEGFTEFLVSEILKRSNLGKEDFVSYEYCKINGSLGCRSYNFLPDNTEFVTMNKLYSLLTGESDLGDKLQNLSDAKERLDFILKIIEHYGILKEDFNQYLQRMLQLDLLILNTDRHVHNYGVRYDSKKDKFFIAPIFDNGRSLNTDRSGGIASKTLSGSFTDQVIAFGFPVKSCIKIDYDDISIFLKKCISDYGNCHEIQVLKARLKEYEYLFKKISVSSILNN